MARHESVSPTLFELEKNVISSEARDLGACPQRQDLSFKTKISRFARDDKRGLVSR